MIVNLGCKNEKERAGGELSKNMYGCIGDPYSMITNQDQLSWCLAEAIQSCQVNFNSSNVFSLLLLVSYHS